MNAFRARDEDNATFFSPRKVKQLYELQQARQDKKVVRQQEKASKAQETEWMEWFKAQAIAEKEVERQEEG